MKDPYFRRIVILLVVYAALIIAMSIIIEVK
jgi:hypothetical protein